MLRIGIDFDNTIACYDRSFLEVAVMMGLVTNAVTSSKVNIKAQVMSRPDGDLDWQRLQGQVYGKHMLRAEMFPGFLEFLYLSKLRGHKVFIVSHKSEFGHFDEDRFPLRDQALLWLQTNKIFDENDLGLSRENVFFESTREDKVRRIRDLACTHFIDDLREVFEEPHFPGNAQKILFCPNPDGPDHPSALTVASWRELAQQLYGLGTEAEVCRIVQARFPSLGVGRTELRKGRGNSRVYELTTGSEEKYALKVYPDRQRDPRPRLETEFSACQELRRRGYPVAEALADDKNLGWGIYCWIAGSTIEVPDELFLDDAIEFVRRLYSDSRTIDSFNQFPQASEACLSGSEIARQIHGRLQKLMAVESEDLADFLSREFLPFFALAVQSAKKECGKLFNTALPHSFQMPSPSDFGSHNALRVEGGRSVFVDFEYFGWDDPVKLASDFYWHPGMRLSADLREHWITSCLETFQEDSSFPRRLNSYLPLYGLRWCLILLNEFLQLGAAHRLHADPKKAKDLARIRFDQLDKSRMLLQEIKETAHGYGPEIQASSTHYR